MQIFLQIKRSLKDLQGNSKDKSVKSLNTEDSENKEQAEAHHK